MRLQREFRRGWGARLISLMSKYKNITLKEAKDFRVIHEIYYSIINLALPDFDYLFRYVFHQLMRMPYMISSPSEKPPKG